MTKDLYTKICDYYWMRYRWDVVRDGIYYEMLDKFRQGIGEMQINDKNQTIYINGHLVTREWLPVNERNITNIK